MLAGLLIGPPIAAHEPVLALIVTSSFWAVAGLGVAPMVPSFMSAGGHVKGMNTAAVLSRMSLAELKARATGVPGGSPVPGGFRA